MKIKKFFAVLMAAVLAMSAAVCSLSITSFAADSQIGYIISYHNEFTTVKITPSDSSYTVRYTIDGKAPTTSSKLYTKELKFKSAKTLIASEFDKSGKKKGTVKVEVKLKCAPVTFSARTDKNGNNYVTIKTVTKNAKIYYTTNGSTPKVGSSKTKLYKGEFKIGSGKTIKAIAVKKGYINSTAAEVKIGARTEIAVSDDNVNTGSENSSLNVDADSGDYRTAIQLVYDSINKERSSQSLFALTLDKTLCDAAGKRAEEIAANYSIGHTRPDGAKWDTVLSEYGYVYSFAAENLGNCGGTNYNDAKAAEKIMSLWMNSAAHKSNILNKYGTRIGIGCVESGGKFYFVTLFGERL